MNHLTLDGVMQAPARLDEDKRGEFTHGGWARSTAETGEEMGKAMNRRIAAGGGLAGWLFGRLTYDDLLGYWNREGGSFKEALNRTPKYVASSTPSLPLPWPNSTLLHGDIPKRIQALKNQTTGVLGIMGSGQLIKTLMFAGMIDEYMLMIHPLVLGSGRRLFPERLELPLTLIDCATLPAGIVIATYEPQKQGR
ncbi:dihydrofolate reductase family protein [Acidihalobacter prosperus]|nr:dihydrofolate reductase family protein [Acidihalobacter prosperus]